jgi:endonuclease YncB( thermonuclease family)
MRWVAGRYTLLNTAPDGDSLHFIPDRPEQLRTEEPGLRQHTDGGITLRLDGIDALETHYLARGGIGVLRQRPLWADHSALSLLKFLGFTSIHRRSDERIIDCTPAATYGAIALRRQDRFGRAVCFVFRGQLHLPHAAPLELSAEIIQSSANYHQLQQGMAYPTFYQDNSDTVIATLRDCARHAQRCARGFWPHDHTHRGFVLHELQALTNAVILPKLYRRLVDHVSGNGGYISLTGFMDSLRARVGLVRLHPQKILVEFVELMEVQQQRLRLLVAPDSILFAED